MFSTVDAEASGCGAAHPPSNKDKAKANGLRLSDVAELVRYVEPEEFDAYAAAGREMGFRFVASGPLVRSSYRAAEAFLHGVLKEAPPADANRYGRRRVLPLVREP